MLYDISKELWIPVFTPNPSSSITEGQSGNKFLLDKKLASLIPNRTQYEIAIRIIIVNTKKNMSSCLLYNYSY